MKLEHIGIIAPRALGLAFAVLVCSGALRAAPQDAALQVEAGTNEFLLRMPGSGLTMSIPKGGLSEAKNDRGGSAKEPGYFAFQDQKKGVVISGWFEPQDRFSSAKKVWETETQQWSRQGLPQPVNVAFRTIEGWDAVIYDMSIPGARSSHIRGHRIEAGTWIDLHLSVTSPRPIAEIRAEMLALLKSIRVKVKQ